MQHLIISYLGVIWTSTDTARMSERDRNSAKNITLLLFLLFGCIGEGTPTAHALFPSFCGAGMRIARKTRTEGKALPSHLASSSALRFLAVTSSSFLRASKPSLARFILMALRSSMPSKTAIFSWWQYTHLRLRTSSSISNSFDFARSCALKGGVRPLSLGWSSGVVVGKDNPLSRVKRAWLIAASRSSRFAVSPSSFSALNVEKD
jgi:hypothetical protein